MPEVPQEYVSVTGFDSDLVETPPPLSGGHGPPSLIDGFAPVACRMQVEAPCTLTCERGPEACFLWGNLENGCIQRHLD